ncbi:MAG: ferrous iron transport protein B [bacterium]
MKEKDTKLVAVIGNPNTGKTTLFNALTGLRQRVGNYAGVTVEKKEGTVIFKDGTQAVLLDLPGTYGLTAHSPDQKIAIDVLLGRMNGDSLPGVVVCVVDASNLERNLYLVSQIIDLHLPVIVALNMTDVAAKEGIEIDIEKLEGAIGTRVVPIVASKGIGLAELRDAMRQRVTVSGHARRWNVPESVRTECIDKLSDLLQRKQRLSEPQAFHEALTLLTSSASIIEETDRYDTEVAAALKSGRAKIEAMGLDRGSFVIEARYQWIEQICGQVVRRGNHRKRNLSDTLDLVLTHKVWGFIVFFGLMALVFQTIFTWAEAPMDLIGNSIHWFGQIIQSNMPAGDLRDLIVKGAWGGVGAVVTFLPQIVLLFLFLGILEDTGYMARAAFIMDRVMSKVGLHGKSFIPLLSSFACAIPGIMATRTIENRKDRIVTMLVAPLMSCSARLPVYALMIAAFIPQKKILGVLSLPGLTLVSMYFLGLVMALLMAWVFKKTLLKSETPAFILELPPYRMPSLKSVLWHLWERSWAFLKRAGTFILGVSIVLWFLASYPKHDRATPGEQLEHSFAGQAGKAIEPLIKPLGFDWKIGIGLIGSVLQREVFVSTMGTIYNISDAQDSGNASLQEQLREDVDPSTGLHVFTSLTAICLMVYYVLSMQCMSTVAVVRRESNGWKWPAFLIAYMTVMAWVGTFIVYRIGILIS